MDLSAGDGFRLNHRARKRRAKRIQYNARQAPGPALAEYCNGENQV
jgi:hypothetical protein